MKELDVDTRIEIGFVAAQLACVIDANYPALDKERVENLAIEFAHVHLAQQEH